MRALRWIGPPVVALAIFGLFLLMKGADPVEGSQPMWAAAFGDPDAIGETLLRTLAAA